MIESAAEALYPAKQLPADYKERYIDWRPLDDDTSDSESNVYEEPSKQPETVPQENTGSNKNAGTSGYDSTASDGSTDNNPNGGSGNTSSGSSDVYPDDDITKREGYVDLGEGTGWTGPNPQKTLEKAYPNGLPNIY